MHLHAYQQRVVDERVELAEKINKLDAFTEGSIYAALPAAEKRLLLWQLFYMQGYDTALQERISAFNAP